MSKQPRTGKLPSSMIDLAVEVSGVTFGNEEYQSGQAKAANAAAELGKLGGAARARKLTAEQRKEIARKAAAGRWKRAE